MLPAFADLGHTRGEFPHSERAADEVLSLPMFPGLSLDSQRRVAAELLAARDDGTDAGLKSRATGELEMLGQ